MTLQDWGALGELIGGVAIIVSLLYVGLQIRHSTSATRAATSQAFITQYNDLLYQLTREEVRDIYWRGLPGISHLQGSEHACFSGLMAMIFRTYEIFYLEKSEGRFDSKIWRGYTQLLRDLMSNPGPREYWELRRHQYSDEFVDLMENDIMKLHGKPLYPSKLG